MSAATEPGWGLALITPVPQALIEWRDHVVWFGATNGAPCPPDRQCPICTPVTAAVDATLHGIRRELDAWPETWEHRCYSRHFDDWYFDPVCACGARSLLHWRSTLHQLNLAWTDLFVQESPYPFRPGTTIEVRR